MQCTCILLLLVVAVELGKWWKWPAFACMDETTLCKGGSWMFCWKDSIMEVVSDGCRKREWLMMGQNMMCTSELGFYIWDLTRDQQRMMLHSRFSFPTTIPCFVHCNIDAFSFLYSSQPPHFALWHSGFVGEMGAVIRTHHITWSSLILFAQGKVHFPLQDGKILALLCFISFFFHHPLSCPLFYHPSSKEMKK